MVRRFSVIHQLVLAFVALREETSMAAEEILQLFDSYWFEQEIFTGKRSFPTSPSKPIEQENLEVEESKLSSIVNLQVRSFSDRCLRIDSSFSPSPRSVITTPKLQKILSGQEISDFSKEFEEEQEKIETLGKEKEARRRRRRNGIGGSLSALEFEELKGFMDLGFVFSEEDKKSSLVSIIPGLQRWGKKGDEQVKERYAISRPYLSEAWEVLDQRKVSEPLMHWSFPALHNEISMKDNLKAWAHTVASTVR